MSGHVEIDSARLVSELGARIGTLGVEVADIAGNLEEVTTRISNQAAQFEELEQSAQTMVSGNREIDRASREAQSAASTAGTEIAESRALMGSAMQHIGQLTTAVKRIEERLQSFTPVIKQIGEVAGAIEIRSLSGIVSHRKERRIQIVAKVHAHRPYRRTIAHPQSDRLGNIVEIAHRRCRCHLGFMGDACFRMLL